MTDNHNVNLEKSSNQYNQLPPVNAEKTNKLWLLLPWVLLVLVVLLGFWLISQDKVRLQSTPVEKSAKTEEWSPPKPTAQNPPATTLLERLDPVTSYQNAVNTASNSVVNIYTTQKISRHPYLEDPFLRQFYEYHGGLPEQDSETTNLGSGVIVSGDGYIITNAHVISTADNIVVALNDGRKATAKVVGSDPESDLAVIKVEMTGLKPLGFREKPIHVGDVVLAIGNPFGVGQTVTQGIISATGRSGLGINTFEDFIQTDAAINPGNSGGALVDANGQLVGINTAIFTRSGGSMGIGFAIPTTSVKQVMNSIIKYGKVKRGWLGIEVQGVKEDPAKLEKSQGVQVVRVVANGPSAQAGLQKGDIILELDGVTTNDANSLIQFIARKEPNSIVVAKIQRGSEIANVNITLSERPIQQDTTKNTGSSQQQIPQELLDLLNQQ